MFILTEEVAEKVEVFLVLIQVVFLIVVNLLVLRIVSKDLIVLGECFQDQTQQLLASVGV